MGNSVEWSALGRRRRRRNAPVEGRGVGQDGRLFLDNPDGGYYSFSELRRQGRLTRLVGPDGGANRREGQIIENKRDWRRETVSPRFAFAIFRRAVARIERTAKSTAWALARRAPRPVGPSDRGFRDLRETKWRPTH